MIAPRLLAVCLLIVPAVLPSATSGQPTDSLARAPDSTSGLTSAVAQRVARAFSEGDASRLLNPSADRVEISLFGTRTFYSSAQALYVLREFFRSHAPRQFRVQDVMEAGPNCFVRGKYEQARRARQFQVYVRLGQTDGEELWRLHEVRIESRPE